MGSYRGSYRIMVMLTAIIEMCFLSATADAQLVAAVLPVSRSVQVATSATAFATIINTGGSTATGCGITPTTSVSAVFTYQTTDPLTNAVTGSPDTPVDIPPGQNQSFVIALTPTSSFAATDVAFSFDCTNTTAAESVVGLNTLLLSASDTPVADIVALAATPSGDGIVEQPETSDTGVFSVATANVGASATITVSGDTGGRNLPVSIAVCETNPSTGLCINPTTPTTGLVATTIAAGATPTFGVFVTFHDTVRFDPAVNRVFLRALDASVVTRGSTSVAIHGESRASDFAGTYAGTFSGTVAGSFSIQADSSGAISGSGFSLADNDFFTVSGTVSPNGAFALTAGSVSAGATFSGVIAANGDISGTWQNGTEGDFGSFSGVRLSMGGGVAAFAGAYTGTYRGDDTGRFTVVVNNVGNVSGTGVSIVSGEVFTVSGAVESSGTFSAVGGSASTGATFSGNVSMTGSITGTWSNASFGLAGTFSASEF